MNCLPFYRENTENLLTRMVSMETVWGQFEELQF